MSSDIDICRLALSHLGDRATVTSLNTSTDTSQQAALCATFYPLARGMVMGEPWSFATKRTTLSNLVVAGSFVVGATYTIVSQGTTTFTALGATSNAVGTTFTANGVGTGSGTATLIPDVGMTQWQYAYPLPATLNTILHLLPNSALNDINATMPVLPNSVQTDLLTAAGYQPRQYSVELNSNGVKMLLCNELSPVLVYTVTITDATQFPVSVVMAMSFLLASMLAGPLIKGQQGSAEGERCLKEYGMWLSKAVDVDLTNRRERAMHIVPWMSGR